MGQQLASAIVPLPGGAFAVYWSSGLVQYNHADWLGSARLFSTPTRTATPAMAYAPFGEGYAGGSAYVQFTSYGNQWTVADSENSGGSLDDFTFRRYSPGQGRWISPDPAGLGGVDPSNPQSWNRYAYVLNNPLGGTDPLGLECVWDDGSYDSADDPDTGSEGGCTGQGGNWVDSDLFENAALTTGQWHSNYGDWSSTPNAALAQNWNTSSATASTNAPDPNSIASGLNYNLSYASSFTKSFFGGFAANNGPGPGISGFAGFNMQKAFVANYSSCTGAFHQTPFGKAVQLGSLVALTPLNTDYGANWFETLSMGSLKAAFVGGMKAGSPMVGEAVEGAIGVVATPVLLVATGIDAGASTLCAGNALSASIPVPH